LGFAILGQKQYPSALVRYWASARAEVFQFSFLFLSSSSVFQLGSGSGRKNFKSPNIAKPYRCLQVLSDTLNLPNLKYEITKMMKHTSIVLLTIIFGASCSNGQNEKKINSNIDSLASKEFYKNGTAKIMTKNEYDSFTKQIYLKNIGKEMQTFPEIESEVQNGDSTIYTFELHGKIKNTKLIGKSLPDFNFKDLNGKYVKLSELIGKPIIINLWFKECIPCIAEMPTLNSIKENQ
jgi:hypothetical protein